MRAKIIRMEVVHMYYLLLYKWYRTRYYSVIKYLRAGEYAEDIFNRVEERKNFYSYRWERSARWLYRNSVHFKNRMDVS